MDRIQASFMTGRFRIVCPMKEQRGPVKEKRDKGISLKIPMSLFHRIEAARGKKGRNRSDAIIRLLELELDRIESDPKEREKF